MPSSFDDRAPLLQFPGSNGAGTFEDLGDTHEQFCKLVGVRPVHLPKDRKWDPHPDALYLRAKRRKRNQSCTYQFTAALTNTLMLTQVVLGAALTALGASDSSRVLITVFGALNTVIAGMIAFLKSRGQPVRARMFRDDLARVVDEIENSAVMWHGISKGAHGYDAIDTNDQVTVRSEIARLTKLYDRAVKNSSMNDPDAYSYGNAGDSFAAALRGRQPGAPASAPAAQGPSAPTLPAAGAEPPAPQMPAPVFLPASDTDESPATKAPEATKPKEAEASKSDDKTEASQAAKGQPEAAKPTDSKASLPENSSSAAGSNPAPASTSLNGPLDVQTTTGDADEEPASAAMPQKHSQDTSNPDGDKK